MWLSWTISVITGEPMRRQLLLGHAVVSPQHCLARPFKSPVASPLSHSHAILALPSPSHIPPSRAHHCVASATWQRCFWDDPCCEILKLISVSDRCFLSIAYYNTSASQLYVTWACDVTSLMEHLTSRISHTSTFSQRADQAEPILSQSILRFKF